MKMLTKEEILNADDLPKEPVAVPEWGEDCGVYVSTLSGIERDRLELESYKSEQENGKGKALIGMYVGYKAKLCARCIVDKDGNRLFDEDAINSLARKSSPAIERLYEVACRINGINEKDKKELEGNLEGGQS